MWEANKYNHGPIERKFNLANKHRIISGSEKHTHTKKIGIDRKPICEDTAFFEPIRINLKLDAFDGRANLLYSAQEKIEKKSKNRAEINQSIR